MEAFERLVVAQLLLGCAMAGAHAQDAEKPVAYRAEASGYAKSWKHVRGFGRVLDLTEVPVVIDEPGLYALQRSWELPDSTVGIEIVRITANDVVLDLNGFGISVPSGPVNTTVVAISGAAVTVRNGYLGGCCEGVAAVRSTGIVTRLDHLDVYSHDRIELDGGGAVLTDSAVFSRDGIRVRGRAAVERNRISCRYFCLMIAGDRNRALDNFVQPSFSLAMNVGGADNLVAGNTIDAGSSGVVDLVVEVPGARNVLRDNTIVMGPDSVPFVLFEVSGSGNTLDGNIAAPDSDGSRAGTGIVFTADGNYYGGNRFAATVPFALGATTQTDWGGNVGY
jgi:hypothetical protein